jgi:glycosyltransferase involved in cell wall biosynthesis
MDEECEPAVGAIPELIDNEINGFLYEPGNIDDLGEKISLLHRMKRKIPEMGLAA